MDVNKQPVIQATEDGADTLFAPAFNASYHSVHGAIQETQTVFIDAAFYDQLHQGKMELQVLEIGFGTGLNALMTLLAAEETKARVHYVGIEAFPITMELAAQLNYVDLLSAGDAAKAAFMAMHQFPNQQQALLPNFSFELRVQDFESLTEEAVFDVIYYDAFAPSIQPELWQEEILALMYRALKLGGVLTTYCAQGAFKRALKAVGFEVEALPGPKGKREMTRAIKK